VLGQVRSCGVRGGVEVMSWVMHLLDSARKSVGKPVQKSRPHLTYCGVRVRNGASDHQKSNCPSCLRIFFARARYRNQAVSSKEAG
jgi:hypothetical protein